MTTPPHVPEQFREVIGRSIDELDTPALLLDRRACDENLRRMAEFFAGRKCRLRPHFKNHKCPLLARRQLAAGNAVGLTCAKLGEAEVLASHGFTDLLVANQVVGARKVARLVEVARAARVTVAIDDPSHAEAISQAAQAAGVTVGVLVEIDIGMGRCGVPPGRAALELARQVERLPGIRFAGLQAYEGHAVYVNDVERRAALVRQAMDLALQTRRLIESSGLAVGVISGGSSSTYQIAAEIDGVDEIQAGTYATMDWRYAELAPEFHVAMTVLARVISKRPGTAVLDVGLKGVGSEFGTPRIKDHPGVEIPSFLSEEHCIVRRAPDWRVGDVVELIPSHACTTCNLHRQFCVHQDGRVVDVWPIEAAGRLT
ncbi:MAG: DSD1 family PLP-dependent enzyme [Thermoguttaceae bacterium]|jgi:D-serine deaminase-like pyridoxal phosphate-dependent protein|nr:DSD1 family PLP-dependent enzyme [Thermoguttaceae bacterium]